MPVNRNNASALLQKVNSQLRGERVPIKSKEEDELAVYLNSIAQKTQLARSLSYEDHGDISISSGKDGMQATTPRSRLATSTKPSVMASKFLKKKNTAVSNEQGAVEENDDQDYARKKRIVTSGTRTGNVPHPVASSALDKVNASKAKPRGAGRSPLRHIHSRESDSESEVGKRPGSADTSIGRDERKFLKSRKPWDSEGRQDLRSPSPQLQQNSSNQVMKSSKQKKESKARGEIVRTLGNVYLTSEEESLAEFIHGLSVSESSVKRPQNLVAKKQQKWRKKAPSPAGRQSPSAAHRSRSPSPFKRTPSPFGKVSRSQSQDSDVLDSMASEIMDEKRRRADSNSSDDHIKLNLMDIDSLLPSTPSPRQSRKKPRTKRSKQSGNLQEGRGSASRSREVFKASSSGTLATSKEKKSSTERKKKKGEKTLKKSDSKSSLFENLGIHMVDELLDVNMVKEKNTEVDVSDESEIRTERSDKYGKIAQKYDSDSEIITELGAPSVKAAVGKRGFVEESISERIGDNSYVMRSRSPGSYSGKSDTETGEEYSEDTFASETRTLTKSQSVSERSKDRKKRSHQKRSIRDESYRSSPRDRRVVVEKKEVEVATTQPGGNAQIWNAMQTGISVSGPYGLQYVDPMPVATHVVSADALEALTAYSPNMLALHEMMKAQLELVSNFMDIQKRIYQSCMDGLHEDFKYTTLEDTKEYIQQHRKPGITFKEALRLVDQEGNVT